MKQRSVLNAAKWIWLLLIGISAALAEPVSVRFSEGLMHGFLTLKTMDGHPIADGESTQVAHGLRVHSRLVFRFRDGSLYDDTTIYEQRHVFRLISDHLIEHGPSFKQSQDVSVDAQTGEVRVRYTDDHGEEKNIDQHIDVRSDLANGMLFTLLKDIHPSAPETDLSMLAATPKPRLVKLVIRPNGGEPCVIGRHRYTATHYVIKPELTGLTGVVAPLVGKEPEELHFWIISGTAPTLAKMEGPLYQGGPIWRIEPANPAVFPEEAQSKNSSTQARRKH